MQVRALHQFNKSQLYITDTRTLSSYRNEVETLHCQHIVLFGVAAAHIWNSLPL